MGESLVPVPWPSVCVGVSMGARGSPCESTAAGEEEVVGGGEDGRGEAGDVCHQARAGAARLERRGGTCEAGRVL